MSNVRVLTLDKDQIHQLLSSHGLFTDDEIKLAARRKVQLDKPKPISEVNYSNWPEIRDLPPIIDWQYQRPQIHGQAGLLDDLIGRGLF